MFANATPKVGISQRVVATLAASAMLLASIGYSSFAQAANFEFISDTVSDSAPSATPSHTIAFTVPTGSSIGPTDSITINFAGFSTVNNVVLGDVTATVNGSPVTEGGFSQSSTQFSFNGVTATGGDDIVVVVASGNITNPAVLGSYEVQVTTPSDYGETEVAIVDTVLVTASVDTTFTFTVNGLATSTAINGETTTGSTTATAIDFGQILAGSGNAEVLGQRLNVTTNALNGFVVTVESDGNLQSANGADIDNFDEGALVSAPGTAWNSPVPNVAQENTWGHWGLTTNDANLGSVDGYYSNTDFGANEFIGATTSPREVFAHTGPSDGSTANIGQADVAYKVEITGLQEAADDYSAVLTYIATPTF